MILKQWLRFHGHTQAWLASQGRVTPARVSQALTLRARGRRPLPYCWIPRVLEITEGAVSIPDEWPPSRQRRFPSLIKRAPLGSARK